MNRWVSPATEWALMVLISAFLFVEFFRLNDFLFASLEHAQGINWVFLPAGFRVLLVLVLGVPGALGIATGTLWLNMDKLDGSLPSLMAMGLASGFGPWCVKYVMEKRGLLNPELENINSACLLQFVLLYAAVNAVSHQIIFWGFSLTDSRPWVDVWPMFVGDLVGALVVLYAFKMSLPWLRSLVQSRS